MPGKTALRNNPGEKYGLTVRTLHHYDAIGLLKPSLHTEAGYRLYTANDT